ncbi:hypothetical protein ABH944_009081 [Caballeronia udeis]|uniref:Uncharacterized protein n=1 Tax=Caballeronia udeis TaxID=1232866 RepID=A0ABW8N2Z4_9BURK
MFELRRSRKPCLVVGLVPIAHFLFTAVHAFAQEIVVYIALAAPMTSPYVAYGKDTANSAKLATDEANETVNRWTADQAPTGLG